MYPEMFRTGCIAATALLLNAVSLRAQPAEKDLEGNRHVKVRLAIDRAALTPGGTVTLAAIFDISEGWHLYWRNPGDSGLPPKVKLKLPPGIVAGELQWPAPTWHLGEGDVLDFIYEKRLVLLWPLDVSKSVNPGKTEIEADIDWLVCREKCVPGRVHVKQGFTIAASQEPSADAAIIRAFAARVPHPLSAERPLATFRWDKYTLVIESLYATQLVFFPYESDADIYPLNLSTSGLSESGSLHLSYPEQVKGIDFVSGVLAITQDGKTTSFELKCPVTDTPTESNEPHKATGGHP